MLINFKDIIYYNFKFEIQIYLDKFNPNFKIYGSKYIYYKFFSLNYKINTYWSN